MNHPPAEDEEKKDDIYIVYQLEPMNTEPEWQQYHWQMNEIIDCHGIQSVCTQTCKT